MLERVKDNIEAISEWFRRCRKLRYCNEADPLLVVEGACGKVRFLDGSIKSSALRAAPILTYGGFKQLLQFIRDSGFTIEGLEGAGNDVEVLVKGEILKGLETLVEEIACSLVKEKVFDIARAVIEAMLGDDHVCWELVIQGCWPITWELTEAVEDGIRATLKLINSLKLGGVPNGDVDPVVSIVKLTCVSAETLCAGLRISLMRIPID